ncbi:MAG: Ppx/GppA family phosphatase [Verrucomicrobia bacterium]|nr:Ppx/GppA family phosphatase [Verrucomicrobiota bacterium]
MEKKISTTAKEPAKTSARTVAVIDIGATAVRMQVAEISADGTVRPLDSLQRAVHLGKDTFTSGVIQPSTTDECVAILQSFRRTMKEYGVTQPEQIRAVATSAVREAENREAFLDRIYMTTQINVEAIEGAEENRLTYIAVHDLFQKDAKLRNKDVAIVEVGGGSTELIFVRDGRVTFSNTYRLGALRMRETLETYRASAERSRALLGQHIQRTVDQLHWNVSLRKVPYLIAVSGDARFAASLVHPAWDKQGVVRIDCKTFSELADQLVPVSVDELVRKYHIPYQEAETIGPALLAYEHLARAFQVKHILVTGASQRDGLLKEMAVRGAWTAEFAEQAVHSATLLAERYGVNDGHSQYVSEQCVSLFRELRSEHGLDERYELLLRIAGLLHEVGVFISDRSHHKHSMYIILNSDLFGLSRKEITLIALVARYHRRAAPRSYHTEYTSLDRDDRLVVVKLAAMLRLADCLDRKHLQDLKNITFSREKDRFIVTVNDVADLTLEQLAMRDKASMFEQVFGTKVELRTALSADEAITHG